MYVAGMLAKSAYRIRGTVPAFGARGGSTVRRSSSSSSTISRLQSTAGNRAVVQLLADGARDTPIDALPELGNRATVHLLTAQREEPKAAPAPDPKAEKKTWQDATPVGGGALYDLVNGDLKIAKILDLALPELVGLAGKGAGAGFDAATEAGGTKGEVKPIGLDTKEVTQITEAGAGWAEKAAAKWLATDESREVGDSAGGGESTGHESGRRIVTLLRAKPTDLTDDDYQHMRKVVGYVHRHEAQRPDKDVKHTPWRYSLMNWGHDPLK